ncbi:MAG: hypothetical protein OEY33_04235, partial [Bdellovibrionales bacterium]|nr:hypothetical protein [Bdellovibrionales bacterium]
VMTVGHKLKVELSHWEEQYLNLLKDCLAPCEITCEQKEESTVLNIVSEKDCRSLISNFVMTHNLGLLGLKQDNPNLEEVFGKMAQGEIGFREERV